MLNSHRVSLSTTFLIGLLLFLMIIGNISAVQAQDDGVTPVPAVIALPQSQDPVESPGTPEATSTLMPTSTPVPTSTPTIGSEVSGQVSETVSNLDGQTVLNLAVSFVVVALLAFFGGRLIYSLLRQVTKRTETDLDNLILEAIRPLIGWFIAAVGFQIATSQLDFLSASAKDILESVYFILYLFVAVAAVWRVGDVAVDWYIDQHKEHLDGNLVQQVVPLLKRLTHLALLILAGLILAAHFGINVLAITAALGITGFAIALAAQDTIANIISGLVIMVDHPFKLGDRIDIPALDTWGDVVEIGIRSSKVLTRDNRLVIIPNSGIADNTVVNYSLPDTTYRLQSDIGIGTTMDIHKVQQVIKEAVRQVEGVLADKPVDVWFTEFGDSSNTFRVRWWVETYADKRRVTDGVNATVQELALREGIDLPNPTYTLDNQLKLSDEDVQRIAKAIKGLN
jgi:small-conductance mechanosensitive channel